MRDLPNCVHKGFKTGLSNCGQLQVFYKSSCLKIPFMLGQGFGEEDTKPLASEAGQAEGQAGLTGCSPLQSPPLHLLSTAVTRHCSLQRLCPAPVSKDRIQKAKRAINLHNAKALLSINATKSITVKKIEKLLYAMLNKPQNFGRLLAYKNVIAMQSL